MPPLHSPQIEVLIVDDEVQTRELLLGVLPGLGYEVATANDGRAAIAALTELPSSLESSPSVYVVMITGYASIDSMVRPGPRAWPLELHRIKDRMALRES
jgi:response regulator RpfG family c-di-GMP phosphodiesterase